MGKKKGGKGKKASNVEEDPHDEDLGGAGMGLGGEGALGEDPVVIGMASKKSAKKKAKKAAAAFEFEEDDEDDAAPAGGFGGGGQGGGFAALADLDNDDDEESDEGAPVVDFGRKEADSGFAALAVDDDDDQESSDDDDDVAIVDFGVKKGKPQAQGGGGGGFSGLTIDDDEDDEDSDDDEAPVVDFGVKKGAGVAALQAANGSDDDSDDDAPIIPGAIAAKAKATAPVKRAVKPVADSPVVPAAAASKKKGKASNKKPAPATSSVTTEDAEMNDVSRARGKAAIEAQKRKDDKKQKEEDIDAILAELEAAPKTSASKSKKDKKKKKKAKEEEEIEALLAEIEGAKEVVTTGTSVYDSKPESGTPVADAGAEIAAAAAVPEDVVPEETKDVQADAAPSATQEEGQNDEPEEEVKLTAAQKKKLKKKERAKAKKVEAAEEPAVGPGKKGKKESAAVKRMKEAVEKQRMEQERAEQEAAEKQRDLEEQVRREEEEAKLKEQKRQEQREKQRLKKEELRKQGLLLSKKELERRKKADQYREQLIASGMIPAAAASETSADGKKKKVVYDSKKRRQQKQSNTSKVAGQMAESATKETAKEEAAPQASRDVKMAPQETPPTIELPKAATAQGDPVAETWEDALDIAEPVAATWEDSVEAEETSKQASEINNETAEAKDAHVNGSEARRAEAEPKSEEEDEAADEDDEEEGSEEDDDEYSDSDEDYSDSDDDDPVARKRRADANKKLLAVKKRRLQRQRELLAKRDPERLRSPIICILGHVDTGKTKILDKIRRTNVQNGEAGGITQQIGATFFPMEAVRKEVTKVKEVKMQYKLPALLIIDTPGHESFTNLRSRGSGLCDLAILVVDIMHGLEPQTLESIQLLRQRKTPFIVALNKVDRMYGWVPCPNLPTRDSLKKQPEFVVEEFHRRLEDTKVLFAEQGFNAALYWENPDPRSYISFVPTSAISGEGIPDLLMMLVNLSQSLLKERLIYSDLLECTVLEVKVIEGFGTTIDVVLTGGKLKEGDTIVVCGLDAPIVTSVRALLTPHPMRELRVKGQYLHHKEIFAAQGVKIAGEGLEKAVAGTQLLVAEEGTPDELEFLKEEVMKDFSGILRSVDRSGVGVYVQASTLGSLEALLEFLRTSNIPVSGINIGPVYRKDVVRCSTMIEKKREYACIMAFDVKVENDARDYAQEVGVRIFTADIIYHLFDQFTSYMEGIKKSRREAASVDVVFPCRLKIFPHFVFNKKDPIVVGVEVLEGFLKNNTPLMAKVKDDEWIDIGTVQSIELNKKAVTTAHKGESVAIKIQSPGTVNVMYGRHFDHTSEIVSKMSRHSIDLLREHFRDDLAKEDWICVIKLKKMLKIE